MTALNQPADPLAGHKCDICGEPANVLMFEPDVYYCWQCHADYCDVDGDEDWQYRNVECVHCNGTGGDPWNDYCTRCEYCDGEGYEWWR